VVTTSELLLLAAPTEPLLRGRARALRARLDGDGRLDELCAATAAPAGPGHDGAASGSKPRSLEGPFRLAIVAASEPELATELDAFLAGTPGSATTAGRAGEAPRLTFVFGGQGPEWPGMGRELLATESVFADAVRACEEALAPHWPMSIARELAAEEGASRLDDVEVLQPTLFAVHVGLVTLLRHWGVVPSAVVGHSFGEVSAAWAAGAISLTDAMRVHVVRSRMMKRLAGQGRMAVVEASSDHARRAIAGLEDRVAVGVVNSPTSVVLAGEHAAMDAALARLAAEGVAHRAIPMPYAVHSPAMRAMMPEVAGALAGIRHEAPGVALFSTVTGALSGPLDALHWARNIGEPARFADAVGAVGPATFVEIGPHPTLASALAQIAKGSLVLPTLRRRRPERAALLATVGALAVEGREVTIYARTRRDEARLSAALAGAVEEAPPQAAPLSARVGALIAARLGVAAVDTATSFRDLGLDSAAAVELARRLGALLGRRLPSTLLFEYPTVDEVIGFLEGARSRPARVRTAGDAREPIALIGIGCRFPGGVDGPAALWRLLEREVDAVGEAPSSRWDAARWFDPDPEAAGKTYSKWAGFLADVEGFDARFFGIAPREAQSMDPQQRLLLEASWEALESAGIAPRSLSASPTGVFVGLCTNDYGWRLLNGDPRDIDAYTFTGNSASVAAGRVAYVLGLEGLALVVDTACSSSLVALHLACRSLRAGECDLALAGGVNLILSPVLHVYFSRLRALSPTGRSRAFDAAADGYVRGEGCGVVALKRLSDARAQGDRILAVVRGSAVNQDGRSNGLTAPNGRAQEAVLRAALDDAGVAPAEVGYAEAHGTGTPLGDPIELRALGAVLGEGRSPDRPVIVGSIKTNLGHTEGAAGVAGVIKAALALGRRRIPRSLHFETPNPHVAWDEIPVRVAAAAADWPGDRPRIATVSSFGFSGTNACVLLEEPPPAAPRPTPQLPLPILLSARSERALTDQIDRLGRFVAEAPEITAADVARTLATGRTHFERRAAVVARDRAGLSAALAERRLTFDEARPGTIALLFSGQGAQRGGMGAALRRCFPVFRDAIDETLSHLDRGLDRPLAPILFADADPALDETAFTQAALFAFEVALYRLLASWSLRPAWLAGHSLGEIAAAHVAGVLDLDDATRLVAARGRLMQALPRGGAMAAIDATEDEVRPLLSPGEVELSALNGPRSIVVSGDEAAVARVAEAFTMRGRRAQRLRVSHAFHSPRMDAMLADLERVAGALRFSPPRIPLVSTVTGRPADPAELCTPGYWVRQARATVRFADAVRALADAGVTTCLEVGPQGVLSALGAECVPGDRVRFVPSTRKDTGEADALIEALACVHVRGVALDWDAVFAVLGGARVDLPTYPFERERHWVEPRRARDDAGEHPLLGSTVPVATTGADLLPGRISLDETGWLAGHVALGTVILPGTAFVELAFEAARRVGVACVEELTLEAPLHLDRPVEVQLAVAPADGAGRRALSLYARANGAAWQRHASGTLGPGASPPTHTPSSWPPAGAEPVPLDGLYARLSAAGLDYGETFRLVTAAWRRDGDLFVEVALGETRSAYGLHPALLDAALHVLVGESLGDGLVMPFSWSRASLYAPGATALRVHVVRGEGAVALEIADGRGRPVASVASLISRPVATTRAAHLHRIVWSAHSLGAARVEGAWALVGAALPGLSPDRHAATIGDLSAALDAGAAAPAVVAFHDDGADPRAVAHRTLSFLKHVLADARLDGARVALVTRSALAVTPDDTDVAVAQAGIGGFARAARAEHPARAIVHVDLDDDPRSLAALPAVMAAGEAQVALRAGETRVARLARGAARAPAATGLGAGTVLVTGGTGALGSLVAKHLVDRHGVRDLVLTSRRGEEAPGAATLRAALEQAGAQVSIVACDVSNRADLARLVAKIPGLSSVIHAAGVLDDGLVEGLAAASVDRVFLPKVDGALHLDALTRQLPLESFVLFSSVAAHLGPAGQASYAAANAVLDALAHRRRAQGLPASAVAFGPWAEVGMAARLGAPEQARLARLGLSALSTRDALAGLDAALATGEPHAVVAALLDEPAPKRPSQGGVGDLGMLAPDERDRALREWVRAETARALGLSSPSDVPWERPLRELGMDSLVAVELRNAISMRLGRPLPATMAFDYPHVAAIARWLSAQLASPKTDEGRVDEMSEDELDELLASLEGS
jgi:acyl transferase domain-containing protein/acyl carrier protein